jgi:hypothetical protein
MKPFVILGFSLLVFAGCSKSNDATPQPGNKTTTPGNTTPVTNNDDSIHMAKFDVKPQAVKIGVTGSTLTMVFNENVSLLFTQQGYDETYAVHLLENFSNSLLSGFDFTTVAEEGNTTFDWVDDNLNNVTDKTISDTTINKQKMVKINVHRPFTFSKKYSSPQDASNEEAKFLAKTTDSVGFSSYCYYKINYPLVSISASLIYSK